MNNNTKTWQLFQQPKNTFKPLITIRELYRNTIRIFRPQTNTIRVYTVTPEQSQFDI